MHVYCKIFLLIFLILSKEYNSYTVRTFMSKVNQRKLPGWQTFQCVTTLIGGLEFTELTCAMASNPQYLSKYYTFLMVTPEEDKTECIQCGPDIVNGYSSVETNFVWNIERNQELYVQTTQLEIAGENTVKRAVSGKETTQKSTIARLETTVSLTTLQPSRLQQVYFDCLDAYEKGETASGVYNITLENNETKTAWCEQNFDGGGWLVFQQRVDGSTDFYRNWEDYKNGFGEPTSNFWLGNHALHLLTEGKNQKLKIILHNVDSTFDIDGNVQIVDYQNFYIENEVAKYKLHISGFSGTIYDAMNYHNNKIFSTKDSSSAVCAKLYKGAWWYSGCYNANLNGVYDYVTQATGANLLWGDYRGVEHWILMNYTRMMIRSNQ